MLKLLTNSSSALFAIMQPKMSVLDDALSGM
jgi:hypothetical protein